MGTLSKPYTFSPNTTMSSSEMNSNFDTLYNEFNGSISAANLATDSVTTAKIADSNVTTAKIADSAVTVAKVSETMGAGTAGTGAWDSWTPTYNGIVVGNGTVDAKYIQIGKTVHFRWLLNVGSTTTISSATALTITLPVAANSVYGGSGVKHSIGNTFFHDPGVANYAALTLLSASTSSAVIIWNPSSPVDAFPGTEGNGDKFTICGTYEAA